MFRKWMFTFFGALAFSACTTKEIMAPCPDPVVSVALAPDTIYVGQSKTMAASWLPQGAEVTTVTWSSASPSIATISSTGTVTGVAVGETNVTVKVTCCNGTISKEATAKVVVKERSKLPTIIAVAPDTMRLYVADKARGTAVVTGEPGIATTVVWTSENVAVASVNGNSGEVTAIAVGSTKVRACATADMAKCGTIVVIVSKLPIPPESPTVTLSADPSQIVVGSTSKIKWSSTGTTACTRSAVPAISAWSGSSATSGSQDLSGLAIGKYDITQSCTGLGGTATATVTLVVTSAPPPPTASPTVTLSADPSQIVVGSTSKIKWSSTGTTSCTRSAVPAVSAWSGSSAISGSQDLSGLAIGKYDITQSCTGLGGTATATVTLVVTSAPPPPTELSVRFSASKGEVIQGGEVFLSGNSSGATSCTAISSPAFSGWSGAKPLNVSGAVSFDTPVGLYTLTFRCSNGNVFASASTTVKVIEKVTPPPQEGWVRSIIIEPKTATLEKGNTLSLSVSVEADEGITKAFTCESSNTNFVRVERRENACFVTVVESPTSNMFVHIIAQTVGYAKSIDGKVLQLQAGALITVKPTPSQ